MFQCCDMFVLTVKDDIVPAVGLSLCLSGLQRSVSLCLQVLLITILLKQFLYRWNISVHVSSDLSLCYRLNLAEKENECTQLLLVCWGKKDANWHVFFVSLNVSNLYDLNCNREIYVFWNNNWVYFTTSYYVLLTETNHRQQYFCRDSKIKKKLFKNIHWDDNAISIM